MRPLWFSTTTPIMFQQTYTTGMVGFAQSQNARLHVFNLNPGTVAPQFYDDKGGLVSNSMVASFAPGQPASVDVPYSSVATIRAYSPEEALDLTIQEPVRLAARASVAELPQMDVAPVRLD